MTSTIPEGSGQRLVGFDLETAKPFPEGRTGMATARWASPALPSGRASSVATCGTRRTRTGIRSTG